MEKHNLSIRTVYLYLFSLVGLVLLIIGCVRFINMGLKVFIFTQADQEITYFQRPAPIMPTDFKRCSAINDSNKICLSEEEKIQYDNMALEYKNWQDQANKIDIVKSRRQSDASINLALIIVGLPLYFYHWKVIKKENQGKSKEINS